MTTTSGEVLKSVTQALSEVLGVDENEIGPETSLVGDLEATSLDVVDLLFQFRKKFAIELTLAEVQRELSGDDGGPDGKAAQGFDDSLFARVTVQDVTNWVFARLPGP